MKSRQLALFPALLPVLLGAPAVVATAGPSPSATTAPATGRWVAETPDAMIEALAAKAISATSAAAKPDGEATLGGVPARRYRGSLSMMGKTRQVAYWFLVKDGSGLALQCGGDGPRWLEQCAEIAGSFRVTGPVPQTPVVLPTPATCAV